jgi:DHA2 family multidrug resistance protein
MATLHSIPEDQVRMASGLFSLHRNLAGAVGVALTATLMVSREDVHTLLYSQRQGFYPLGTQEATATIREVLVQDGKVGEELTQMANTVLRQKLENEATLASYQDLFAMFAVLALVSLLPILLTYRGKTHTGRKNNTKGTTDIPRKVRMSWRSPR